MLDIVLWAILAIWVGLAVLVLVAIVSTIGVVTIRMLLDLKGVRGSLWCPALHRTMRVVGVPAGFIGTVSGYDDLKKCEAFGEADIRCRKWCVRAREAAAAAKGN